MITGIPSIATCAVVSASNAFDQIIRTMGIGAFVYVAIKLILYFHIHKRIVRILARPVARYMGLNILHFGAPVEPDVLLQGVPVRLLPVPLRGDDVFDIIRANARRAEFAETVSILRKQLAPQGGRQLNHLTTSQPRLHPCGSRLSRNYSQMLFCLLLKLKKKSCLLLKLSLALSLAISTMRRGATSRCTRNVLVPRSLTGASALLQSAVRFR